MILPIVAYGSPVLRVVCKDIDPDYPGLPKLIGDMWETMYYSSGVGLAVPRGSTITTFAGLNDHTKVGVLVGSVAAMLLNQQHVRTSTFGFEEDMLAALAAGEIDAAAATPLSAGYYNLSHPYQGFAILPPDDAERDLVWNAAVGIRKPDDQLLVAIDAALDRLRADGTVETIYANYGIPLLPAR